MCDLWVADVVLVRLWMVIGLGGSPESCSVLGIVMGGRSVGIVGN